jgi:hypothetical protein
LNVVLQIQSPDWQFAPPPAPESVLILPQLIVPLTPILPQQTPSTAAETSISLDQSCPLGPIQYRCIAHDAVSGWWADISVPDGQGCNSIEGVAPCGSTFVPQPDGSFRFALDLSLIPCTVLPPWARSAECKFDAWGCVCMLGIVNLQLPGAALCELTCKPPFHLDAKACRCIDPPVPFGVPIPHLSRFV